MSEPGSVVAGYLVDKLVATIESAVKKHVVERWTKHRAEQFFKAVSSSLLDVSESDEEIARKLDELLADDARSQVVFEAYRSVCLSRSRSIGPRIIAFQTAELLLAGRRADDDDDDEAVFAAAEELTDSEFEELESHVATQRSNAAKVGDRAAPLGCLILLRETQTVEVESTSAHSVAPIDLASSLGRWALKLKRLGLLSDDLSERYFRYDEDSERYIDEPGTARVIEWTVLLEPAGLRLARYVSRAASPGEA